MIRDLIIYDLHPMCERDESKTIQIRIAAINTVLALLEGGWKHSEITEVSNLHFLC